MTDVITDPSNAKLLRQNMSILVVDDEDDLRELIKECCREVVGEVLTASNGKMALEILRTRKVDLVLSDITMPVMNGLEMLQNLHQAGNGVPVVFLTGWGSAENVRTAKTYGAIDFLDKPLDPFTLEKTVAAHLDKIRSAR